MIVQEPCFNVDLTQQSLIKNNEIDFFITGLPRSRLAWIANYLTYGNMMCHFDPIDQCISEGLDALLRLPTANQITGIAESGLVMYQDQLAKLHPNAKWIVIQRPHSEVKSAFEKLGVPLDDRLARLNYKLEQLKLKDTTMVIPFEDLDRGITTIATVVNPGWHCPKERHDLLVRLNVQSKATVHDLDKIPEVNALSKSAEPVTPTKTQVRYFEILQEICGDNKFAYRWLHQAVSAATIFDHVMDNDIIDHDHYDTVMKGLLLEWGINPFFRQYATNLVPIMSSAISAWQHSTGVMKRVKHYDIYTELPISVAFILGGQAAVDKFSPMLRPLVETMMLEDNRRDEGN